MPSPPALAFTTSAPISGSWKNSSPASSAARFSVNCSPPTRSRPARCCSVINYSANSSSSAAAPTSSRAKNSRVHPPPCSPPRKTRASRSIRSKKPTAICLAKSNLLSRRKNRCSRSRRIRSGCIRRLVPHQGRPARRGVFGQKNLRPSAWQSRTCFREGKTAVRARAVSDLGPSAALFPTKEDPRVAEYSVKKTYGHLLGKVELAFEKEKPLFALAPYHPLDYPVGAVDEKGNFEIGRQRRSEERRVGKECRSR